MRPALEISSCRGKSRFGGGGVAGRVRSESPDFRNATKKGKEVMSDPHAGLKDEWAWCGV